MYLDFNKREMLFSCYLFVESEIQFRQSWGFIFPKSCFNYKKKLYPFQGLIAYWCSFQVPKRRGTLISGVKNFTLNIIRVKLHRLSVTMSNVITTVLWRCIPGVTRNWIPWIRRFILGPIAGTRMIFLVTVLSLCHHVILSRLVRLTVWIVLCVEPWAVEGWVCALVVLLWLWSRVAHGGSRHNRTVCWRCFWNCLQYKSWLCIQDFRVYFSPPNQKQKIFNRRNIS